MDVDRWIGEFSYPVYLVHILCPEHDPASPQWAVVVHGRQRSWPSALAAAPLVLLVEYPLERWRQRFFRADRPQPAAITGVAPATARSGFTRR